MRERERKEKGEDVLARKEITGRRVKRTWSIYKGEMQGKVGGGGRGESVCGRRCERTAALVERGSRACKEKGIKSNTERRHCYHWNTTQKRV